MFVSLLSVQKKPFGGMQIVLCGDLFQLPPVTRGNQEPVFVSDSHTWRSMNLIVCYLHEQHRQDDEEFVSLLNAIRDGVVDTGSIAHCLILVCLRIWMGLMM